MRDTWRDDDYRETKVYYSVCGHCGWEEQESHGDPSDCIVTECPDCGSDYILDEVDYV